jgi:hypothetical protein
MRTDLFVRLHGMFYYAISTAITCLGFRRGYAVGTRSTICQPSRAKLVVGVASYNWRALGTSAFEADEGYLFFDHIYSTSYDTTPKRYLTSFAITRDFFHSFFGTAEDDLDQHSLHISGDDREGCERMQDVDTEGAPADQRPSLSPETQLPSDSTRPVEDIRAVVTSSVGLLSSPSTRVGDMDTSLVPRLPQPLASARLYVEDTRTALIPSVSPPPATQPPAAPMFVFGQELQDRTISLQEASRFLFRRQIRTKSRSFIVLSPAGNDCFRIRQADSTDTVSIVNALQLPSEAPFLTREQGKQLKLTAPTTILEDAR